MELAEDVDILTKLRDISYSDQYDIIFDGEIDAKKVSFRPPLLDMHHCIEDTRHS